MVIRKKNLTQLSSASKIRIITGQLATRKQQQSDVIDLFAVITTTYDERNDVKRMQRTHLNVTKLSV